MKGHTTFTILVLSSVAFVSSCSGGGGGDDKENFNRFVKELATEPVDDADPVSIDGLDFNFSNDPNAFDELFQ